MPFVLASQPLVTDYFYGVSNANGFISMFWLQPSARYTPFVGRRQVEHSQVLITTHHDHNS